MEDTALGNRAPEGVTLVVMETPEMEHPARWGKRKVQAEKPSSSVPSAGQ